MALSSALVQASTAKETQDEKPPAGVGR